MVGQRGVRVSAVISELGGEKIDIIEYSDDVVKYITNALSPAKVIEVKTLPKNTAIVVVPVDQLSLAIGKDGQNVRLAAKLTGWKLDVKSDQDSLDVEESEDGEIDESEIAEESEE
jgi:N utilization substance protein A